MDTSTNGTFVDGLRLTKGVPYPLGEQGALITFGACRKPGGVPQYVLTHLLLPSHRRRDGR